MKSGKTGFSMIVHNTGIIMADGNNPDNNFKGLDEVKIEGIDKLLSGDELRRKIFFCHVVSGR